MSVRSIYNGRKLKFICVRNTESMQPKCNKKPRQWLKTRQMNSRNVNHWEQKFKTRTICAGFLFCLNGLLRYIIFFDSTNKIIKIKRKTVNSVEIL